MAKQNNRLKPALIEADRGSLAALEGVAGYAPVNAAYSVAALKSAQAELAEAQAEESRAAAALATARDRAVEREWKFHELVRGAKDQVIAQFGRDSNEVQAVGLTKASERKAPTRKKSPQGAQA